MDGLDLLAELLSRFGTLMVPFHQVCSVIHERNACRNTEEPVFSFFVHPPGHFGFSDSLFGSLSSRDPKAHYGCHWYVISQAAVFFRSSELPSCAPGHLVKNLNDKLFSSLVSHVISKLTTVTNAELLRSYMSCAAAMRFLSFFFSSFLLTRSKHQKRKKKKKKGKCKVAITQFFLSKNARSRYAGKRLSKHLTELSPILLSFIEKTDDELRESCLQV